MCIVCIRLLSILVSKVLGGKLLSRRFSPIAVALIPSNRYKLTQPTWGRGKGRGLLGAIAVRTHGEDGEGRALAAILFSSLATKDVTLRRRFSNFVVLARAKNFTDIFALREIFLS